MLLSPFLESTIPHTASFLGRKWHPAFVNAGEDDDSDDARLDDAVMALEV